MNLKIVGLVMIFISAGLYLAYPTPELIDTLWVGAIFMLALFGGAFAIHGVYQEKEKKEKKTRWKQMGR